MQSPDAVAMQTSVVDAKLQSPVLHGNKLGCKRRLEDVPQLSGATPNPGKLSRGESSEGGALQAVGKPKAELVLDDGTLDMLHQLMTMKSFLVYTRRKSVNLVQL